MVEGRWAWRGAEGKHYPNEPAKVHTNSARAKKQKAKARTQAAHFCGRKVTEAAIYDLSFKEPRSDSTADMEGISSSRRGHQVCSGDTRMKVSSQGTDCLLRGRRKFMRAAEDKENLHASALSARNQFRNEQEHVSKTSVFGSNYGENQMDTSAATLASNTPSETFSANQLAAKDLQLRLHGKTDELMVEETRQEPQYTGHKQSLKGMIRDYNHRLNGTDSGLVKSILHNKQYSRSACVDEEYECACGSFEDPESKKAKRKASDREAKQSLQAHKQIVTQEERCQFCFSNQSRPKHLTVSIANYCYLMLPPWEPLVDGHCLLVPMQHEGSSRNVDGDVWEELRNYKKCLLQMFAKQGRDVLFMETVINLSQQRRHCVVECIPLPSHTAEQAPLYFKKAIDEAEDEWSQHDAKKLIDTSVKGLRGCIPKNFPYFHVEFGLRAGYVHVIDNERDFERDFGRNVVIGMLNLLEEGMHKRRHNQQTSDQQRKSALDFRAAWDPFDWTKLID